MTTASTIHAGRRIAPGLMGWLNIVACLLCLGISSQMQAQEDLVKAENLVRAQAVPLSRLMTFEQQNPGELLDYAAWIALRALDPSASWNPKNRAWNLYRINLRVDLEASLRRRWQTAGGTIRSLSQNPDTSLAKYYAEGLRGDGVNVALSFYQSESGKKFLAYQNELRRTYYRGKLVAEQMLVDPEYGSSDTSPAERRRAWLARNKLSLEAASESYAFHSRSMQRIFPSVAQVDLVFALVAGAPPGSQTLTRLENALNTSERETVRSYLTSPTATAEVSAVKAWQDSLAKTKDILPLLVGDLRSMIDLIGVWKQARSDPSALPRSIARVDPTAVNVPDSLTLLQLEEVRSNGLRECIPSVSADSIRQLDQFVETKRYQQFENIYYSPINAAIYVTRRQYGTCVVTTTPGYPVLAIDSFANTVTIDGMSERQIRDWRRKIAQEVAADGVSDSLIVLPNGNAFEVSYAIDARSPTRLLYLTRFLPAGTFSQDRYRTVETPLTFKGISTTSTTGTDGVPRNSKSIVSTPEDVRQEDERRKRS